MSTYGLMARNLGARARKLEIAVDAAMHDYTGAQGYGAFPCSVLELVQFLAATEVAASAHRAGHFVVSNFKVNSHSAGLSDSSSGARHGPGARAVGRKRELFVPFDVKAAQPLEEVDV